jgi:hypothetical protein
LLSETAQRLSTFILSQQKWLSFAEIIRLFGCEYLADGRLYFFLRTTEIGFLVDNPIDFIVHLLESSQVFLHILLDDHILAPEWVQQYQKVEVSPTLLLCDS